MSDHSDAVLLCLAAMVVFSAEWILRGVMDATVAMVGEATNWLRTQQEGRNG